MRIFNDLLSADKWSILGQVSEHKIEFRYES